jgi:hypothetical protein
MSLFNGLVDYTQSCATENKKSTVYMKDDVVTIKASFGSLQILSAGRLSGQYFTHKDFSFPIPVGWKVKFHTKQGDVIGLITEKDQQIVYSFESESQFQVAQDPSTAINACLQNASGSKRNGWLYLGLRDPLVLGFLEQGLFK